MSTAFKTSSKGLQMLRTLVFESRQLAEKRQLTEIFICKERTGKEMYLLTVEDYKNGRLSIFKIHNYISLMRVRLVFEKCKSDCITLH